VPRCSALKDRTLTRTEILAAIAGIPPADPLAGAFIRIARELGEPADAHRLFEHWTARSAGSPRSEMRYRWELSHRHGVPLPRFAPDVAHWTAWHSAEEPQLRRDPYAFEERLLLPIAISENCELLARSADAGDELANALLRETLPIARRDFAGFV
jgi:hypothetical protein